ncbi:Acrylyl-CoA reductase AcuI [Aureliella helgolandensis]|uniref:Acrylyl-CoA reductase AcuI n=2 Tax=Aureliella helgolandensis TaxID=2527968 RepID=A0A518GF66_9BACT|nr:Acrylyl-CoA reductase AcuI [Aureliella helgolandensis]
MVEQVEQTTRLEITSLTLHDLPAGEVTIAVEYSSLNFKDAMACQGHRGIIGSLPHVPGIDAAGVVLESTSPDYQPGNRVLVTGYDLGQKHWGGWAQRIRVPATWVVPLPSGLSTREAMIIGTAGFTAAQSVLALQRNGVLPEQGEVLVTGATGGVGSMGVKLLAHLGYQVVAVTGKLDQRNALRQAGATRVVSREEVSNDSTRPMLSAQWAGAIDTVGGQMLTSLLRGTQFGGCVTTCGLVAGAELNMTVYPFILRGISLCGVASAECPYPQRLAIWKRLSTDWKPRTLPHMVTEVTLRELPEQVDRMQTGHSLGRVVVRLNP